jgi:Reverse transcriptase (RNA-dependent DNA polymerase)
LHTWATAFSNAYLEAKTKYSVYNIVGGPEFCELEGHTLLIVKALYGLCRSGLSWYQCFADCLQDMGFFPSKGMRPEPNSSYECIRVFVDDLAIVAKTPNQLTTEQIPTKYGFKLNSTGMMQNSLIRLKYRGINL